MASFYCISQPRKLQLQLLFNTSFLILFLFYVGSPYFLDQSNELEATTTNLAGLVEPTDDCSGIHSFTDYNSKCIYIKSHVGCKAKGYIDYLQVFYCTYGKHPLLGHTVLLLWLLVLFYLLGDTAANYFCSSLDSLSKLLNLSPTIAGVTLLSLGNGAPDVFASIVSFTRSSNGDVGLNSVLGGAFFVSSAVVGVICILVSPQEVSVDKSSFLRDVLFFLFALFSLLLIIFIRKATFWGSICFLSTYFIYVCLVCIMHLHSRKEEKKNYSDNNRADDDFLEIGVVPLLGSVDEEATSCCCWLRYGLELPLYLPRRLTIPVVSEERWSKLYAITSVTLAPILLAEVCNSQAEKKLGSRTSLVTHMVASFIGLVLGNLAYVSTNKCNPPKKCLFPWLAGGFLMSVTWTYIIAEELVSLLVSLGYVLGISPSVLGLTVLAWGNSLGDLIANVAMALHGGPDGAQIALSGCYAGPMFNTILGLGMSFVISSWSSPYLIPEDSSLYETLAFIMGGLLWALVVLPRKCMRMDRFLGIGLLSIYFCFLFFRLSSIVGILPMF